MVAESKVVKLGRRAQAWGPEVAHGLSLWHTELLCALDTIGLPNANAPTYDDFKPGLALDARLQHLCNLCALKMAPDTPTPTRMHLWLRLTKTYLNAIRAQVAQPDIYESHYRPRLSAQEHRFIEALATRSPARGALFQALLPLAVREDVYSSTARVITLSATERHATDRGSPTASS